MKTLLFIQLVSLAVALRYECDQRNVSCGCGFKSAEINAASTNLERAIPYSWSMLVSIRIDGTHRCTGTLLSDHHVLTAASCFPANESRNVTIAAGIYRLDQPCQIIRHVDQINNHPNWGTGGNLGNNLALLRLAEPLEFDKEVLISPACLPSTTTSNTTFAVVGWNYPDEQLLQQLSVYATDRNDSACAGVTNGSTQVLCIYQPAARCSRLAEMGSPLFRWLENRWELIGIQSLSLNTCLSTGYTGVFVRLLGSIEWIETILNPRPTPVIYRCDRNLSCGCGYSDVAFSSSNADQLEDAVEHSWSMVVSLRSLGSDEHSCAGTLLSRSYILTSASCLLSLNQSNVTVFAGITNLSDSEVYTRTIEQIFIHPNYTAGPRFLHNTAVLRINRPLIFQNNPILAKSCIERTNSINGTSLVLVGWKKNQSSLLKQIRINDKDVRCLNESYDDQLQFCAGLSTDRVVSSSSDTSGLVSLSTGLEDLGGSVFSWTGRSWSQVGLVGHPFNDSQTRFPMIYTRLSSYWQWMEDILSLSNEHLEPSAASTTSTSLSSTGRTTSTPLKKVTLECKRNSKECGCGLNNVVYSSSSEAIFPQSWSMMVSIRGNDNEHLCSGTILSDLFILTAAHCVSPRSTTNNFSVAAGIDDLSQNGTLLRRVDRIFTHENYTQQIGSFHDLAILQLDRSLSIAEESSLAQTCLPNDSKDEAILIAVGWKRSEVEKEASNVLQQVSVRLLLTCFNSTDDLRYQFCVREAENQPDDFGEAVFIYREQYWEQLGILSAGDAGVYLRLSAYTDWIQRVMQNTSIPIRKPSVITNGVCHAESVSRLIGICLFLLLVIIKQE